MEMILLLIPISVLVIGAAIAAFIWAVDNGQYEDVNRDGDSTLFDEPVDTPFNSHSS